MSQQTFTAGEAAELSGVAYANLDYWARSGFLKPSIEGAKGSGSQRRYSFADVVAMRSVQAFREMGVELKELDFVRDHARQRVVRGGKLVAREATLDTLNAFAFEWIVRDVGGWMLVPTDELRKILFDNKGEIPLSIASSAMLILNVDGVIESIRRQARTP